jgi:hypothetical protein
LNNNSNLNLKGGADRVLPLYTEEKNSPFIKREEQNINTVRNQENKPRFNREFNKDYKPEFNRDYKPDFQKSKFTNEPVVNLQIYDMNKRPPSSFPPKKPLPDLASYMSLYNTQPYLPPQFAQSSNPFYQNPYEVLYPELYVGTGTVKNKIPQIPIIKEYNINISGPSADHGQVNQIYEDMLPNEFYTNTTKSLTERFDLNNHLRSRFIKNHDGEDINLGGGGQRPENVNNLLNYLKFLELNPNSNIQYENPYKNLPDDTLIYKSCYPIRYDSTSSSILCSPNSIGLNIRIYKMNFAEYYSNSEQDSTKKFQHNIWRDIHWYNVIKENILKNKKCPNFVMLNFYYICEKCDIDFDKLSQLKGNNKPKIEPYIIKKVTSPVSLPPNINIVGEDIEINVNGKEVILLNNMPKDSKQMIINIFESFNNINYGDRDLVSNMFTNEYFQKKLDDISLFNATNEEKKRVLLTQFNIIKDILTYKNSTNIKMIYELNPEAYSGKALVAITEAPTCNILAWASRQYRSNGNIKRMISNGYHNKKVWLSILFQLMAGLCSLQKEKMYFENFDLESNVFIRDINYHENNMSYWIYIINNISYYVPNYGYLVMIDTSNKDSHKKILNTGNQLVYGHSISSEILDGVIAGNPNYYDQKCYDNFIKAINQNNFTNPKFTNEGGCKPPNDILTLLYNISGDQDPNYDISKTINKYMVDLMHNRIGTYLNVDEKLHEIKDNIDITNITKNRGTMFILSKGGDNKKFVAVHDTKSDGTLEIFDRTSDGIITIETGVNASELTIFSPYGKIQQDVKPGEVVLNIENLLETYIVK